MTPGIKLTEEKFLHFLNSGPKDTRDFVDELIKRFKLNVSRDTLRSKIKKTCQSIQFREGNLWEITTIAKGEKASTHFFTLPQRQLIMKNVSLLQYLKDSTSDKNAKEDLDTYMKCAKEAIELNESDEKYRDYVNYEQQWEDLLTYSLDYIDQIKFEMMIEAVFNIFYTKFDGKQLAYDLNLDRSSSGSADYTAESVLATRRLKHHAYFELKPEIKELLEKIKK